MTAKQPAPAPRPRKPTVEERVTRLEDVADRLDKTTNSLKRSHAETRRRIGHLERLVERMPATMAEHLDQAITTQTAELKTEIAESETRQADRVTGVARQAPAWTIVGLTLLGGVALNLLAVVLNQPHIG